MKTKIMLAMLMALCMVGAAFAVVTPTNPVGDDTTNAATYDFTATSTNPFALGGLHVDLGLGGVLNMPCTNTPPNYPCQLLGLDISTLEGVYAITMDDVDGQVAIGDLTIDHFVDAANDFNFGATNYLVSYTEDCVDTVSGIAVETGQYSYLGGPWTDFVSGNDFTATGTGAYDFRGYCEDAATNTLTTGLTSYILPASPPVLEEVLQLSVGNICGVPGIFPCVEPIVGAGAPVDMDLKLSFDKDAALTVTLNGGVPVVIVDYYADHIISLSELVDGSHTIEIEATDGVNSDTYDIQLDVSNAGGSGSTSIDIRGTVPIPPTPSMTIIGSPVVVVNDILPGDYALVQYSLSMVGGDFTRVLWNSADPAFVTPVVAFCGEDINVGGDDISGAPTQNVLNPVEDNWVDAELQSALDCADLNLDGNPDTVEYDVFVKIPTDPDDQISTPGAHAGTVSFGNYAAVI